MPFTRQQPIMLVAALTAFLTVGCETKVAQCNKLIDIANRASNEMQSASKAKSANAVAQLSNMANSLDQFTKEVEGLEIKDETLKGFQTRLAGLYQQTSQGSRNVVKAIEKKDRPAAMAALTAMQTGNQQEEKLVKEVNAYCGAK